MTAVGRCSTLSCHGWAAGARARATLSGGPGLNAPRAVPARGTLGAATLELEGVACGTLRRAVPATLKEGSETERVRRNEGGDGGCKTSGESVLQKTRFGL